MNAFLLALIFTVAVFADFFWEPFSKKVANGRTSKIYNKAALGEILLLLGWWQAVVQYSDNKNVDSHITAPRTELATETSSLRNSMGIITNLATVVRRFKKQTDSDLIAQPLQ